MDNRAEHDFIIAGAGHNALITACYLAASGARCLILDARSAPGGGATTEEVLGPGYAVDTCATGHTLIQQNPLIRDDDLGLVARHGLAYLDPDPVAHVALPDGNQITMHLDAERTIEEFARFSREDAEAYRRLLNEFDELRPMLGKARAHPLGQGPSLASLLADHPRGGVWTRRMAMSARDVICHEFSSPQIRAFMGWMAFQTAVPIDQAGTGLLAYQIIAPRQARSWSIPKGGSGRLVDALVGYLTQHGARFEMNTLVSGLILEDGRCVGVRSSDGREFIASKGVVSTIHVKHLIDMAPADAWDEAFRFGVSTYNVGVPFFATYLATTAPPDFETPNGPVSAVSAGYAGWIEDLVASGRAIYDEKMPDGIAWLLVATPSLVDTSRAPEGHHTVKFLTHTIYDLPGEGPGGWASRKEAFADDLMARVTRLCPGFTRDVVRNRLVKSPPDIEAANRHMIHGAPHGGDRSYTWSGGQRPAPGWAAHRTPIKGLWQTGGTTHPGGSITGFPGRNAARVVLQDIGKDPASVMSG